MSHRLCTLCAKDFARYLIIWRDVRGSDMLCEDCAALFSPEVAA